MTSLLWHCGLIVVSFYDLFVSLNFIPFFFAPPSSVYAPGGVNEGTRGGFSLFRGPFTPSQWMELEHQALIYKHLVTNVPIPSSLLVSLKKSLSPYTFSGLSSRSYASNCKSSSLQTKYLGSLKGAYTIANCWKCVLIIVRIAILSILCWLISCINLE